VAVFTVAGKEFRDHIENKRFLVIFGALLLVVILSISQGIKDYNQSLESYKEMTSKIESSEVEPEVHMWMPEKPSILLIFYRMLNYFAAIGAVLAIAMGFDLISKEKEEGSLKSLLSHPLHRDSVILGKLVGAVATFGVVMLTVTLICTGSLMIYGISPSSDEFLRIMAYMLVSLLFLISFFSIAMACSVIAKSSGLSVTYCIGIVLVLSFMLPAFGEAVADQYAGEMPTASNVYTYNIGPGAVTTTTESSEPTEAEKEEMQKKWEEYQKKIEEYWQKKRNIEHMFNMLSPDKNYKEISNRLISGRSSEVFFFGEGKSPKETETLAERLSSVWSEIFSLLTLSVVMLIGAYLKFMRLDIR